MIFKPHFKLYLNGRRLDPQRTAKPDLGPERAAERADERHDSGAKGGGADAGRDAQDEEVKDISGGPDQGEINGIQRVRSHHL